MRPIDQQTARPTEVLPSWGGLPARWPDLRQHRPSWTGPAGLVGPGILVLVLLHVALRGWVVRGASFREDDYVFAANGRRGLSVGLLTDDYNGHLQAGQNVLVWLLAHLAPLSYPVVAVGMVLLSALTVALFARLLLLVCGARNGILVPLAVYALCPIGLNSTSWWAAALQAVPLQVAMILAVDAHVRHTCSGRRRWWWAAVGAFVLGLVVTEKALLILPVLVGLTVLVLRPGSGRLVGQLRPHTSLWLTYATVALGYLGLYRWLTESPGTFAGFSPAFTAVRLAVLDTFAVGLVGGPWRTETEQPVTLSMAPPGPVLALVLLGALAVLAGSVWWRGAYAVRVWLLLLGYLAMDTGLMAATRLDLIGAELGRDPRYVTDAVPVAVLCLALVLLPRGAAPPVRAAPALLRRPEVARGLIGAFLFSYLCSCLVTTGALARQQEDFSAAGYLATLRADLSADPDTPLVDSPVPPSAMTLLMGDKAVTSVVTAAMGLDRTYGVPGEHLLIADLQGRLRPVDLKDPVRSKRGPVRGCGWEARGPDGVVVALPEPAEGVVKVGYFVGQSVRAVVETAGARHDVVLLEGLHDVYVPLPPGALATDVTLTGLPVGVNACLGRVSVGPAEPRP